MDASLVGKFLVGITIEAGHKEMSEMDKAMAHFWSLFKDSFMICDYYSFILGPGSVVHVYVEYLLSLWSGQTGIQRRDFFFFFKQVKDSQLFPKATSYF